MKKLVCLFTVVLLLMTMILPTTASASTGVTLRNGIKFGDTMAQVRAKETFAISSSSSDKLHTVAGTIQTKYAAMTGISISYYFDYYGQLEEVLWQLPKGTTDTLNNWAWLYREFNELYGRPYSETHRYLYDVVGKAYEAGSDLVQIWNSFGGYGKMESVQEWIVGDTKIELVLCRVGYSSKNAEYCCFVSFTDIGK